MAVKATEKRFTFRGCRTVTGLLTVLQAVPPPHSQIETGKPEQAGSPSAQRDTKYPTGRTRGRRNIISGG